MSDGRRDARGPLLRPIDPPSIPGSTEAWWWNRALEKAAREARSLASAGEVCESERAQKFGVALERRILALRVEAPELGGGEP